MREVFVDRVRIDDVKSFWEGNPVSSAAVPHRLGTADYFAHYDRLREFTHREMFTGVVQGWMLLPRGGRLIPDRRLRPLASRWGWFLYAKGNKPLAAR